MARKRSDSVISFKTDSEPEDESELAALEDFTQSHVDVDFSDDEGSTSTATHVSWRRPSQTFIRNQARELKISSACRICDQPGRSEELIFCSGCGTPWRPAHKTCLAKSRAHVPRRARRRSSLGDEECDEVDYVDYVFTRYLLRPPSPTSRPELHADDVTCSWIGVPVFQSVDRPQIHIWSRLQDLLQMSRTTRKRQYPNLISFIGDTGSGKSTLIRTMIKMARPEMPSEESVPVPGLPEDRFVSTSSDIHAYADPLTLSSRSPMVYVDSEGFVGSDRPVSQEIVTALSEPGWLLQCKFGSNAAEHRVQTVYQERQDRLLKKVNQFLDGAENRINVDWGRLDYPDPRSSVVPRTSTGRRLCRVQHNTRKLIVSHLYPRVLYGFSDVVCFVTTNGRSSNTFLGELIDWAQESHDRILNQRMKPALVIIINKDVETGLYTSSSSDPTEQLLRSFQNTERFENLQALWEEREHPITTTADLLRCYYSDFKVVLIPALTRKSSPVEAVSVSKSIKKLYEAIRTSVTKVRSAKINNGTESDLATLNTHLSRSLTVLGQDLRAALDLHDIVREDSPIPTELSDHMAATLQQMSIARGLDKTDEIGGEQALVDSFTPYVGTCISAQTSWIQDHGIAIGIPEIRLWLT
ncbi:calcium-independent phospholipase a2 [Fusarium beomiforme]|uniref:Calcium-independent phospholipase a2 n=1 Tax=Fusarium beomiforme TaxID=44412 RepID=A0A9P5ABI4_9HYPO|nr:calcium-independent phospholipase a2 [Fusarium beomiforme]